MHFFKKSTQNAKRILYESSPSSTSQGPYYLLQGAPLSNQNNNVLKNLQAMKPTLKKEEQIGNENEDIVKKIKVCAKFPFKYPLISHFLFYKERPCLFSFNYVQWVLYILNEDLLNSALLVLEGGHRLGCGLN